MDELDGRDREEGGIDEEASFGEESHGEEDDLLVRIESNDPAIDALSAAATRGYFSRGDWERLGVAIGKNVRLRWWCFGDVFPRRLKAGEFAPLSQEAFETFFRGVSSNRSITQLRFVSCDFFQGEIFRILRPLFNGGSLKSLSIDYDYDDHVMEGAGLQPAWFHSIASALREFDSLDRFELSSGHHPVGDDEMTVLTQALVGHSDLGALRLSHCTFGIGGYEALATLLQNPNSRLVDIGLVCSDLDDQRAAVLASGLARCAPLKRLNLSGQRDIISATGWQAIFGALQSPGCSLEELDLRDNEFNDEAIISLATALTSNTLLRALDVSRNYHVTSEGWLSLQVALQSPNSALEKLEIDDVNDATAIALAHSLERNSRLQELLLTGADPPTEITDIGWAAFSRILCNPTSVVHTYGSNHTLQTLGYDEDSDEEDSDYEESDESWARTRELLQDVRDLLRLNRDNNRSEAARLKIIRTHFSGGFVGKAPFLDMELALRPHAFAWMGRGGESGEVDGHFFEFLRGTVGHGLFGAAGVPGDEQLTGAQG